LELLEIQLSPPFEGGVAGSIDYLTFTMHISRQGWLTLGDYHRKLKDENRDKESTTPAAN